MRAGFLRGARLNYTPTVSASSATSVQQVALPTAERDRNASVDWASIKKLSPRTRTELTRLRVEEANDGGGAHVASQARALLMSPQSRGHLVHAGLLDAADAAQLDLSETGTEFFYMCSELLEWKLRKQRAYEETYDRSFREASRRALSPRQCADLSCSDMLAVSAAAPQLRAEGLFCFPLLDRVEVDALEAELLEVNRSGHFREHEAQICNRGSARQVVDVRNPLSLPMLRQRLPATLRACRRLQGLAAALQAELPEFRLSVPPETMLYVYPKGARYFRHTDANARRGNPRLVTLILYANGANWESTGSGGKFQWWPTEAGPFGQKSPPPASDIAGRLVDPSGGIVLGMWSRTTWHEVLPVESGCRYSLVQSIWSADSTVRVTLREHEQLCYSEFAADTLRSAETARVAPKSSGLVSEGTSIAPNLRDTPIAVVAQHAPTCDHDVATTGTAPYAGTFEAVD